MRKGTSQERGAAGSRSSLPDTPSAQLFPFSLFINTKENNNSVFTRESLRLFHVPFHIPGKGQNWEINKEINKHPRFGAPGKRCPGSIRSDPSTFLGIPRKKSHQTIPKERVSPRLLPGAFGEVHNTHPKWNTLQN